MSRYVHFASRLTGWNAIKSRVAQLGLKMTDAQCKQCTAKIKALADVRPIAIDDADSIIRTFHGNLGKADADEEPLLPGMTDEEQKLFEAKQKEIDAQPEKRAIDAQVEAETQAPAAKKVKA